MPSRVYVIELKRAAGRRRDPRIPWVYVGSSARSPEERLRQHRRGYKSSGLVKRFALRLRPDLYEDLEPFRGSKAACRAETERAKELAACGFVAHSDGTSYGRERRRLGGVGPRASLTGGRARRRRERRSSPSRHSSHCRLASAQSCFMESSASGLLTTSISSTRLPPMGSSRTCSSMH